MKSKRTPKARPIIEPGSVPVLSGVDIPTQRPDSILTADIHLDNRTPVCRTDDYFETVKRKVQFVHNLQRAWTPDDPVPVLDAGDMLNRHTVPPEVELVGMQFMRDWITVPGNHDMPNHNLALLAKSSLSVLKAAGVQVLVGGEQRFLGLKNICVTGVAYGEELKMAKPHESKHWHNVALVHTMTYVGKVPYPGAPKEGNAEAIMRALPGFDLVVTGHNHEQFTYRHKDGRLLVNPGSLMRRTADQMDFRPCVWLWYADANEVVPVFVPIEKGVVTREHVERPQERNERLEAFVRRLDERHEVGLSFEKNMEEFLAKNRKRIKPLTRELVARAMGGGE